MFLCPALTDGQYTYNNQVGTTPDVKGGHFSKKHRSPILA